MCFLDSKVHESYFSGCHESVVEINRDSSSVEGCSQHVFKAGSDMDQMLSEM